MCWVRLDRPRLAWHVWHDGAIHLVTGGREQALPGLTEARRVVVTLRSRDNGGALVTFEAAVRVLDQASEPAAVAALARERLNSPAGAGLPARWSAGPGEGSTVVRLTPLAAD